ncbi:MAG TPA: 16S rRNA (cytosine(967)-C(5))-methyltransferase RsmB [Gemmatimonadaceae bacterium]|nr:16S rRNA (cytosine(967)-C(5))-methyltransferase RsmB [Gemmatimonadaceae bacterium]
MLLGAVPVHHSSVTDARVAAADVLADLRDGLLLDAAFDRRTSNLDARDRRWTQELVYGLLRRREDLDSALHPRVRGGIARLHADLTDLLRLGVYQLLYMNSVPPYAAIAQTVQLAKVRHGIGASKLANAVLRRVDREREQLATEGKAADDEVGQLARKYSHPRWLVERWVSRFGSRDTERLLQRNNEEARVVLRPWVVVHEQLETSLERSGVLPEDVPLVPDSIQLPQGTALLELAAWRQGHCFVQDPAATLVTRYAALAPGSVVGDFCAAPGGKSLELSRDARYVLSADRSPARLRRMAENLDRLDAGNVGLVAMDAARPAASRLDAILLDVPCTGTGTFRRHPDARWRLRHSDLAILAAAQAELLRVAATHVMAGGLLVYSTCSLEHEENDEQVDAFLAQHPDWTLEGPPAGTVPDEVLDRGRLRVLPQVHGTDGSFAARLRRGPAT